MTNPIFATVLVGLVACGGDDGGGGGDIDATTVPATVTVSGVASTISFTGRNPEADVAIAVFREGETASLTMTTSAADGSYSLVIPTSGAPLDGYLLGTQTGKKDNYLYPPRPLTADISSAPVLMVTPDNFGNLGTLARVSQEPTKGFVGVQVFNAANEPVAGVVVTSSPPGTVKYNNANGLPTQDATATEADGIAYIFNVTAGTVMISANGGGLTFFSHPVVARADQLTTTIVQP